MNEHPSMMNQKTESIDVNVLILNRTYIVGLDYGFRFDYGSDFGGIHYPNNSMSCLHDFEKLYATFKRDDQNLYDYFNNYYKKAKMFDFFNMYDVFIFC